MSSHRLLRAAAAIGLVAGLAACGNGDSKTNTAATTAKGATGTATDKVEVKDFAFKPKTISVKAGTTVTWTFSDSADHTVASKSGSTEIPQSPESNAGKTYTHMFATAGTYDYVCTIHNSMTGTVVVTAA